ncbi:NAD(P)(+)--arginine ADP-ribosyltransferase 2-like [Megalobrama amblycephala]|uniref:NAD(P)(+)--arginine ADP-ribosyltransferase 2-like n=1 Tax=Megalobrama amblycephala TaxID=75352 RepID=UPI002014734D|nr:NAD(P)(+)--arginine ADP-ribosyltransferase 2-like [Megalobrama amblycephala]
MLLITEALLLIFAALGQDHRGSAGQIFSLDMAPNSVDDQYKGCIENMKQLVETKLLEKEKSQSEYEFAKLWEEGVHEAKTPEDNLSKNHSVAVYVYTHSSPLYEFFNNDVRSQKQEYKDKTFKWYSLHFLLTDAIQILKKTQNRCYFTYRGTDVEFDKNVLNKEVRFGSFTSSSLNKNVAQGFGTKSCFQIKTCEGADVSHYSIFLSEKEVLIPPYEKFKVIAVNTRKGQKDLWCDTVFTLNSTGTRSDLNCAVASIDISTNSSSINFIIGFSVIITIIIICYVMYILIKKCYGSDTVIPYQAFNY